MRTTSRAALALAAVLLLATACGTKSGSTTTDTGTPVTIPITINGTTISPNGTRIDAAVNQEIELDVTSDSAQEIHVHTGGDGLPIEVEKGHHTYTFTVDRPGLIEVEVEGMHKTLFQLEVQ